MSTCACLWCDHYIGASNRGWPGSCSPVCRDEARRDREAVTASRAAGGAAARERRRAAAA